jgi:AcrR family transcriptional regulator
MSNTSEDPRTARTRQAVILGARSVISQVGLSALTYDAVASAANVSRTTLYKYWPTLDALVKDALYELTQPPFPMTATDDLRADLTLMFTRLIGALNGEFTGSAIASLINGAEHNESLEQLLRKTVEDRRAPAVQRISRQRKSKAAPTKQKAVEPDPEAEILHDLIAGAIYYRRFVRRVSISPADVEQMIKAVAPLIEGNNHSK